MRIALDYDGTITADPLLWRRFARLALDMGHEVKVVTSRDKNPEKNGEAYRNNQNVLDWAGLEGLEVVFCGFKQKQECWGADIWIDDSPHMVASTESIQFMVDKGYLNLTIPEQPA